MAIGTTLVPATSTALRSARIGGFMIRRIILGFIALLTPVAVVAACGSDDSGNGGTNGSSGCEAACKVCPADPCADCSKASERYRDEFEKALFNCVSVGDACSPGLWEGCSIEANGHSARRSIDDDYRDACLQKKSACDAEGGASFADDICLASNWFTESW